MDMRIDSLSGAVDRFEDPAEEKRRRRRSSHPEADTDYEDRYEPSQSDDAAESDDPPPR